MNILQRIINKESLIMKSKLHKSIKVTLSVLLLTLIFNGCMMMGIGMKRTSIKPLVSHSSQNIQTINTTTVINHMIEEAVSDLLEQKININSIAIWQIKSQTAGLNVDMIRRKLVTQLVNATRFKVVSRQRLDKLLEEHSLSLSGAIDEKSAVEIGKLIGVDGFIDGYATMENEKFILNFSLIETSTGVIVWAKTVERML